MSQEMAMFWFAMSILILLWGLSQYHPTPSRRPLFTPNLYFSKEPLKEQE